MLLRIRTDCYDLKNFTFFLKMIKKEITIKDCSNFLGHVKRKWNKQLKKNKIYDNFKNTIQI